MSTALLGSLEPDWPPAHCPAGAGAFLARAVFGNGRQDVHGPEKRWPRTSTTFFKLQKPYTANSRSHIPLHVRITWIASPVGGGTTLTSLLLLKFCHSHGNRQLLRQYFGNVRRHNELHRDGFSS